jgi:hypothetical protein
MQFRAQQPFEQQIGGLSISGLYSKTPTGERKIQRLELGFHSFDLQFSRRTPLLVEFGQLRQKRLGVEAVNSLSDGVQIDFTDGLVMQITASGTGDRAVVRAAVPEALSSLTALSIPFGAQPGQVELVDGIPLMRISNTGGQLFISLPEGSRIDSKAKRLLLRAQAGAAQQEMVLERLGEQEDPYLYWFSRDLPLASQQELDAAVRRYLDRAYQYWRGTFSGETLGAQAIADMGIPLISESIRRGEYRLMLAAVSRFVREALLQGPLDPAVYRGAAYWGNLPAFVATRQEGVEGQIARITELIRAADFSLFDTPGLVGFILDHAPFSLLDEVLRLADRGDLAAQSAYTLMDLVELYLDCWEYTGASQASSARVAQIVEGRLWPAVSKTGQGLFLRFSPGGAEDRADLYSTLKLGRILIRAGGLLQRQAYAAVGRTMIASCLRLADGEGFLPVEVRIRGMEIEAAADRLAPDRVYPLVADQRFLPQEYPLYALLGPGTWLWTAAQGVQTQVDGNQYRFSFSFPVGETHYLIVAGVRPPSSVVMHRIPWKTDPEYFRYSDGWAYDGASQVFFAKITHQSEREEIVLSY